MSFYWPHAFWFLAVPIALAWFELTHRRRNANTTLPKIVRAEADHRHLVLTPATTGPCARRRLRWRLWLGLAFAVLALARPQWGRIEEPVFDQAREILIAVDLSRSMLAEDVKPSRLARAKLLITSLLERLEGERVGLIVFAGTSFLQSPLSADYEILREFLPALDPGYLPEGGTDFKSLLDTSLNAFAATSAADRYLIILSDGESQTDDWQASIPALVERRVRVLTLGIGTESGAMIPDGEGSFIKDERGAVVMTRLQSRTMQDLAQRSNGVYKDASQWVDLAQLLRQTVETGLTGEFREAGRTRLAERFQWVLAPAVLILLWSYLREFPVHPRSKSVTLTPPVKASASVATTVAVGALMLVSLVFVGQPLPAAEIDGDRQEPNVVETAAGPLAALVGQLAIRDELAARDYAELARTTLTFGQRVKGAAQPVPPGPIRDGLASVETGEKLDAKAADWAKLKADLEALLDKPDSPPQEEPPENQEQNPEQNEDQKSGDGQKGQGKSDQKEKQEKSDSEKSESEKSPQQSSEGQEGENGAPPPQAGQSAFGDLPSEPPPPPPPGAGETQQIGGQPDRSKEAEGNPELTIPLQKLEQLKNQDAPARLYELMQDPKGQPAKKGRDW